MKSVPIRDVKKRWLLPVFGLFGLFVSCSSPEIMEVRQYHLKSVEPADFKGSPMVRGEQMYRMRGAVTMAERKQRLGQYYTVNWKNEGAAAGPLKIVMDYQQAATGSKILRMSRDLPAGKVAGSLEFKVAGESYRTNGRVLAWRVRMLRGSKVIAEKRSYLWK